MKSKKNVEIDELKNKLRFVIKHQRKLLVVLETYEKKLGGRKK